MDFYFKNLWRLIKVQERSLSDFYKSKVPNYDRTHNTDSSCSLNGKDIASLCLKEALEKRVLIQGNDGLFFVLKGDSLVPYTGLLQDAGIIGGQIAVENILGNHRGYSKMVEHYSATLSLKKEIDCKEGLEPLNIKQIAAMASVLRF